MTRILITNAWSWLNKGDAAIVITMAQAFRKYIPQAEICILSYTVGEDSRRYEQYNIRVLNGLRFFGGRGGSRLVRLFDVLYYWFTIGLWAVGYRLLGRNTRWLKGKRGEVLDWYATADIIVSCGGEVLWGGLSYMLFNLSEIFLGKLLGKPVVIYSQSVGPFRGRIHEWVVRAFLNRADLITLRETVSERYLKEIGVSKPPTLVTADSAFLLQPIAAPRAKELLAKEGIDSDRPLVGMTLRWWGFPGSTDGERRFRNYIEVMSRIADYVISKLDATIVFMPQVIVPSLEEDDRLVAKEVFELINHKARFKLLSENYSPEELKGIIGQTSLFIGTRMHSNIFATSMYVPTVAIGYRHKTEGIMAMLGLEEYVCEIATLKFEELATKIDRAWRNRREISQGLAGRIKRVQEQALLNAKLVGDIISGVRGGRV